MLTDGLNDAFSGEHSGWHIEDLAAKLQITREAQDAFSARFQQRFATTREAGRFVDEIVAVEIKGRIGMESFANDEAPCPDTTMRPMACLAGYGVAAVERACLDLAPSSRSQGVGKGRLGARRGRTYRDQRGLRRSADRGRA